MSNLFVGNLDFAVTDEVLQKVFTDKGFKVASARVIRERDSGTSRGFGFVELGTAEDAARAINELNGFNLEGRALQVNEARSQAPRSHGGRPGGGRPPERRRGGGGPRRF
jgi:cold-inducible RNA-binding protein